MMLTHRISRLMVLVRDKALVKMAVEQFPFFANAYQLHLSATAGSKMLKPSKLVFSTSYARELDFCYERNISTQILDSSAVEAVHNNTKRAYEAVGGGGAGKAECVAEGQRRDMENVVVSCSTGTFACARASKRASQAQKSGKRCGSIFTLPSCWQTYGSCRRSPAAPCRTS